MANRTAIVAGGSGLVGGHLLDLLRKDDYFHQVYVLTRRKLNLEDSKLKELVIDFDQLSSKTDLPQAESIFCCLGTTIKKAGTREAFKKVDYKYPLELAKAAAEKGAKKYFLVSALGAAKGSFFFYNRVKGEVEEGISEVSKLQEVHIFRPSLILGERNEQRSGEGFAKVLMRLFQPIMLGPLKKYRPIHAYTIAKAMLRKAKEENRGVHIHESEDIKAIAGEVSIS